MFIRRSKSNQTSPIAQSSNVYQDHFPFSDDNASISFVLTEDIYFYEEDSMSERYQISDRAAAAIVNAALKDVGYISKTDSSFVIDRSKLRRQRDRYRKKIQEEEKEKEMINKFGGTLCDGRRTERISDDDCDLPESTNVIQHFKPQNLNLKSKCSCLKKKKIEFERHSIDYYGENWRRCTVTKKTTNKQILEQTESEYKFFVSIEKLNKSLMRNNDILDSKMQLNQEHGDTLNTWNNVMVMKMQKVVKLTKELLENENFANYSKTDAKNSLIKMKSCINLNDLQSINENRRLNNENIIINGNDKSAKDKCTTITTPKTIKYKPFKSNRSMRSNKSLKSNKSHKISISESSYSKNTEDDVIKKINRISEKIVKSFLTFRKLQIPKLNNIIQSKYSLDNINQIISKEIRICFLNIEQVKSDDYFTTYIYKKSTKAVMWDTTKFEYVRPEHVDNSYDNFVPKLAFKPNDHCESYYNWKNLNFDKHPYRLEYQNMNLNSIVDQYKNNYLFSSHQNKTYSKYFIFTR
ncbi:hypothetical protein A3Q56_08112 [Intoshia linei]|uniref:Uncharacterized protein n=1 Tax=Intoshia linei TaxID=1819745 RepID=A0A177ARN7_9BILA|nr:hypothetical protein A3Q56_08112 [Intoshia linei]